MADRELAEVLRSGPFEHALRVAIRTRGLSLDRIHARLLERGVHISLSSLSYWQRGRSRPERAASLVALRELEVILTLPAYSLIGLLGPPRPRGRRTDPAPGLTTVLSHHEQVVVGADGRRRLARARLVVRAVAPGADRCVVAHPPGVRLLRTDYCRPGRSSPGETGAFTLDELIFDRPLIAGETRIVEYSTGFSGPAHDADRHVRHLVAPVQQHVVQVKFEGPVLPVRCFHTWSPDPWSVPGDSASGDSASQDLGELHVDAFGTVHLVDAGALPGARGIRWEWA
ncbi:hypothetical protein Pth03_36290 [Planotetraspora thailandica]|uniref:Uncharacterized protein n=1 Tax=Planotetraspora thailandica TaxID=487172 RepID=A0A8J3V315_9ACTN|nr:hypothetical protein [Planotetraspora thailandica]GII55240.1 hypothetical protein Pth03_36290 [Planotetraspora thailandica]